MTDDALIDLSGYAGRTADLAPGLLAGAAGDPLSGLAGPDGRGLATTGLAKLAGRVVTTLFTPLGSQRYRPARGTTLVTDAWAGRWRTPGDVRRSFAAAALDLARQLAAEEAAADPADERFGSVALDTVDVAPGVVTLGLRVTSAGGAGVGLVAPVPVTPR